MDEFEALSVITPCPTGTDLFEILYRDPLPETHARKLLTDMLSGLRHIHDARMCFRDIKPENFLFQTEEADSRLLLANFEHAITASDDTPVKSIVINPEFVAPEVIRDDVIRTGATWRASDMYSIGVIMYVMLTGKTPFAGNTTKAILKKVIAGVYELPPVGVRLSANAKALIASLMDKDYTKRPTAHEALNHAWFTKPSPVPTDDTPVVADEKHDVPAGEEAAPSAIAEDSIEARKQRKAREAQIQTSVVATAAACVIM